MKKDKYKQIIYLSMYIKMVDNKKNFWKTLSF